MFFHLSSLVLLLGSLQQGALAYLPIEFDIADAKSPTNLRGLDFVSRLTVPYGPDIQSNPPQTGSDQPYKGYGFGMSALEEICYDTENHYLYGVSNQGYINVFDLSNPAAPVSTDLSIDMTSKESAMSSMQICVEEGVFFVSFEDLGTVEMYETVKRSDPRVPKMLKSFDVGPLPQFVLPNKSCQLLAVGNANRGKGLDSGSITFIRKPLSDASQVMRVPIDEMDDAYLVKKGLNMPLSFSSLEYWDEYGPDAEELDFSEIRANYKSSIFLEPKAMAWSGPNEEELLVNLQENNGLMRIDAATGKPLSVASYGLKDHSEVPVDINAGDKKCALSTYDSLFAMRNPDIITTVRYNNKTYVITANEGDSKEYNGFEEKWKAKSLFKGNKFALPNVIVPEKIMNPQNFSEGHAALFNKECEGDDCVSSTLLSVGSSSIDFISDPKKPIFYRMVMIGGRGWSIYELPNNPDNLLKLVFDSADYLERRGCEDFPWAHNSEADEQFAPTDNLPNNTLWQVSDVDFREKLIEMNDPEEDGCFDQGDGTPGACPMQDSVDERSSKDGAGIERITVGVACGRLFAVMATEKSSVAYLFDLTNVGSPELKKVFHLSEATRHKSPGLAYNDGSIGEIDPENILFFPADKSPSGKPSLLFGGAYSGTFSYWEFDCVEEDVVLRNGQEEVPSSGLAAIHCAAGLVAALIGLLLM